MNVCVCLYEIGKKKKKNKNIISGNKHENDYDYEFIHFFISSAWHIAGPTYITWFIS